MNEPPARRPLAHPLMEPGEWVATVLLAGGLTLIHRAPPRLTTTLAHRMAGPLLALWPRGRGALLANLRVLRPAAAPAARAALARATVANYLCLLRGVADLWADPAARHPQVEAVGWEPLLAAARGGGALLATAHFGAWDQGAHWLARQGVPIAAVVDPFASAVVERVVREMRAAADITLITREAGAPRRVVRQVGAALAEGRVVALLVDRPLVRGGVPVTLCGQPTRWPAGLAWLARQHPVPLFVGQVRTGDGGLWGAVSSLTPPALAGRAGEALLMQTVADAVGRWIQDHPTQWYMFRRAWRD